MNKKEKRAALKSALTAKVEEKKFVVVDEIKFDEIKTKNFANILKNLEAVSYTHLDVYKRQDQGDQPEHRKSCNHFPGNKYTDTSAESVTDCMWNIVSLCLNKLDRASWHQTCT